MSMRLTPSSTARRSTRRASSGSSGSPKIPRPVRRMAPKPNRLTMRSPPKENVPAGAAFDLASWSDMASSFRFGSYRFYRRALPPRAPSSQPDSARMAHIACKGVVEETELDALSNVLTGAVGETLQPAHVSLWLREPELLLMRAMGKSRSPTPTPRSSRLQSPAHRGHPVGVVVRVSSASVLARC